MFCYKINPDTNDVYAMTHSCNKLYFSDASPLCPYADTDKCEGDCGIEEIEEKSSQNDRNSNSFFIDEKLFYAINQYNDEED